MHCHRFSRLLAGASVLALATALSAAPAAADSYSAGDFHNHTTCTDGSVSIEKMITESMTTFGLEWLADAGHGTGTNTRDCRFDDPEMDSSKTGSGKLWEQTIGAAALKGDVLNSTVYSPDGAAHRAMWRWQMIDEINYQEDVRVAQLLNKKSVYIGLEQQVPGHEHASTTVVAGQTPWIKKSTGNASALAEYEFRFDRGDTDTSGKGGTPGTPNSGIWKGKVANATGTGSGTANHKNKAVPGVAWMQANYPTTAYFIPAHLERAGVFNPNGNNGWNIEHLRDFNNAGPTVSFGFESMPGHQASDFRGEYSPTFCGPTCPSVGINTRGGSGIYAAQIGGVWDALLGEGRNWFFFTSSDFHNRGQFSPYVRQSTQDFYPGEYQKHYILTGSGSMHAPQIVNRLRSGNSYGVAGDLIGSELTYTAENLRTHKIAKMGDTLVVRAGDGVRVTLTVTLPTTPNNSPYSFPNPSLAQLGINQPLNRPVLDHVDFIKGNITGVVQPTDANYTNGTNPSAAIFATFYNPAGYNPGPNKWSVNGNQATMVFTMLGVNASQYIRVRGTNIPVGTPYESDASGNPVLDGDAINIPCLDAACPGHLKTVSGQKRVSYDVAGWSDVWFYTNPIFIRLNTDPKLLVEVNDALAKSLATED